MDKRVYGVLGIRSIMANWNADFSGRPKSISTGEIFGSDKALKYPIKRYFMEKGEKVLYTKTYKTIEKKGETEIGVRSLKERYENLFDIEDLKAENDHMMILKNLFSAADVKNFGATFAEEGNNISITGAVQIGQGFNKYDDSYVETQQILSPFRNPKDKKGSSDDAEAEERGQSTLGSKTVSNEAHYVYPFVINSSSYNDYIKMGVTEGYTDEDYNKLKEAMIIAATFYSTNAKMGCDNELAVFIETDKDLYLPDLAQYVKLYKDGNANVFELNFDTILNPLMDKIRNIEIYYNSYDSKIIHSIKDVKKYNIFTKEEV
ncbi:CRISPR-associated protein [Tissierella creatinini]|nr:CRISPR-associated protein [Tissierella creatinini]TJX64598.1 CRISPR-associated protein [Soehngenia saccharolytica]